MEEYPTSFKFSESPTSQETPDDEQSDIVLVERAYLYLTKGAYPEGATKNEKKSIYPDINGPGGPVAGGPLVA